MDKEVVTPIALQIKNTSQCIRKYIDDFISKNLKLEITGVEGMALGRILAYKKHHPDNYVTASEVMKIMHINKSATSKLLNNLENKGYITISKSVVDGRVKPIEMTTKSLQIKDKFEECFREIDRKISSCFTDEEASELQALLERIQTNLNEEERK